MPPEYVDALRPPAAVEQGVGDRTRVLQVAQFGDKHEVLPTAEYLVVTHLASVTDG